MNYLAECLNNDCEKHETCKRYTSQEFLNPIMFKNICNEKVGYKYFLEIKGEDVANEEKKIDTKTTNSEA